MSFRQVNTKTWHDRWFNSLGVIEKLLYMYLFTNGHASVSGLFEMPLRVIWFETGITGEEVLRILGKFETDGKMKYDYEKEVIWIFNMFKHQGSKSPKLKSRINQDLFEVPRCQVSEEFYKRYNLTWGKPDVDLENLALGSSYGTPKKPEQKKEPQQERSKALEEYEKEIGPITPHIADSILDAVKDYTEAWVIEAIRIASKSNARKWAYIDAVLSNMKAGSKQGKPAKITKDTVGNIIEELINE